MKIDKKKLPELIERKIQSIQKSINESANRESYEVKVTQEYGYYVLWIGEKLMLSLEGAENFFNALIGFENGLTFKS